MIPRASLCISPARMADATPIDRLKQWMLTAESFTYQGACAEFRRLGGEQFQYMTVTDRLMQRLRRAGLITFKRAARQPIWTATEAGRREANGNAP